MNGPIITGTLREVCVCSHLDLHGVQLHLAQLDDAAEPWTAMVHIAVGRGDAARQRAHAFADGLQTGQRLPVQASQRHVIGTTLHLLGDVTVHPAGTEALHRSAA